MLYKLIAVRIRNKLSIYKYNGYEENEVLWCSLPDFASCKLW